MNVRQKKEYKWLDYDTQFYDAHAASYVESTFAIDLSAIHDRFLHYVAPHGLILDVGSGSGRDTLAFLKRGYRVEALEPSSALANISAQLTGIKPSQTRAQDIIADDRYDGVWACASLVHIPPAELPDTFSRIIKSARRNAPIYCSFKQGSGVRVASDGRRFTDLTEFELRQILSLFSNIKIREIWKSDGEGSAQGLNVWLNSIFTRN